MDGESVCGIIPRCDYCGEPDAGNPPDWNGETGNHRSCEPKPAVTLPSLANLAARGMSTVREIADSIMGELDVEVYDSALPQPWVDEIHRRTGQWPQEYGVVAIRRVGRVAGRAFIDFSSHMIGRTSSPARRAGTPTPATCYWRG